MEYFKRLTEDEITVEVGRVRDVDLTDTLHEYTQMGYREFKLELVHNTTPIEWKVIGRGDRAKVKQSLAKWYPDLLTE